MSFGEGATEIEVEVNTIDELVRAFADFMDCSSIVLKIDVEGFEQEVLKGASILDDLTWWRALVEFSPIGLQNAGKSVEDSWQFFRAYKGVVVHGGFDPRQGGLGVLPIKPPRHDVDILIGEGSIPNRDGLLAAL